MLSGSPHPYNKQQSWYEITVANNRKSRYRGIKAIYKTLQASFDAYIYLYIFAMDHSRFYFHKYHIKDPQSCINVLKPHLSKRCVATTVAARATDVVSDIHKQPSAKECTKRSQTMAQLQNL